MNDHVRQMLLDAMDKRHELEMLGYTAANSTWVIVLLEIEEFCVDILVDIICGEIVTVGWFFKYLDYIHTRHGMVNFFLSMEVPS